MTAPTRFNDERIADESYAGSLPHQPLSELATHRSRLFLRTVRLMEPIPIDQAITYALMLIKRATHSRMLEQERQGSVELLDKILPKVYTHDPENDTVSNHVALVRCIENRINSEFNELHETTRSYGEQVIRLIDKHSGREPLALSFGSARPVDSAIVRLPDPGKQTTNSRE